MDQKLVFRFDVDTELCLREGLPRLLELADRLSVPFTFFVNPGRSIRRRDLFTTRYRKRGATTSKLPISRKLGYREAVYLFMVNPPALPEHAPVLRQALAAGHEVGLHGGRNHGDWSRNALRWEPKKVREEVDFGIKRFRDAGLGVPKLFASPGWASPLSLPEILASREIEILADTHGPGRNLTAVPQEGVVHVHTAICGEPGGIGYLEFMRAKGADNRIIVEDFMKRLRGERNFACVYDHPYYAGRQELELLESLIIRSQSEGWEIESLSGAIAPIIPASSR